MFDRPVIINAFSRGGSNVVWNLLLSHPRFISPLVETHQMFLGLQGADGLGRNVALDLKYGQLSFCPQFAGGYLLANFGSLNPSNYTRRKLSQRFKAALPGIIENHAMRMLQHPYLRYKNQDEVYDQEELRGGRISLKSINGTIYLSPELQEVFPNASFIGLIRNGFALWEARSRRGTFRSAKKFGYLYRTMVEEMEIQATSLPKCKMVRFEGVFENFEGFMAELEEISGESYSALTSFRFKVKGHYDANGNYSHSDDPEAMRWIPRDQLFEFLNPNTNTMQIDRVSKEDRDHFLSEARPVMERYGYLP